VVCLAAVSLMAGVLLAAVSFAGLRSEALWTIDRIVVFNVAWQGGRGTLLPLLTTRRIFKILVGVGLVVSAAAVVGILGARTRHKSLVCTYVALASTLSAVTLMGGVQAIQRKSVVEPLVHREVMDLCNATRYIRLSSAMGCKWASAYAPSEVPSCGNICQWRVDVFGQMRGCAVMPRLCTSFFYEELNPGMGASDCVAAISQTGSAMYGASEGRAACQDLCDKDIRCAAYAYSSASLAKPELCLLGAGVASAHPSPEWSAFLLPTEATAFLSGGSNLQCYRRTEPRVLDDFRTHGTRLAVTTLTLGLILAVSTVNSCRLMYNVNMRRRGKPSATELGAMMCCPCCAQETHSKFHELELSSSEGEVEEEGGTQVDTELGH